jgi:hypothetical protein
MYQYAVLNNSVSHCCILVLVREICSHSDKSCAYANAIDNFFYYYLVYEAIGTAAIPGLLCQPRVIVKMIVEKQMECRVAGETEVLGENLPQRHFCPSKNST